MSTTDTEWDPAEAVLVRAAHAVLWTRLKALNVAPVPNSEQLRAELIESGVGMPLGRVVAIAKAEGLPLADVQVDPGARTRVMKTVTR